MIRYHRDIRNEIMNLIYYSQSYMKYRISPRVELQSLKVMIDWFRPSFVDDKTLPRQPHQHAGPKAACTWR